MTGKMTKTEKWLLLCAAVFTAALCAACFGAIAAGRNGTVTLETDRTAAASQLVPVTSVRVNINTAPAEELMELPGIGEVLAGRIIAHREANGPFGSIGQLLQVEGIGTGIYRGLEDLVTVEDEGT